MAIARNGRPGCLEFVGLSSLVHPCPSGVYSGRLAARGQCGGASLRNARECKETFNALNAFLIPIGRLDHETLIQLLYETILSPKHPRSGVPTSG